MHLLMRMTTNSKITTGTTCNTFSGDNGNSNNRANESPRRPFFGLFVFQRMRHDFVLGRRNIVISALLVLLLLASFSLYSDTLLYRPLPISFPSDSEDHSNRVVRVLCIDDRPYGQTFNQILTIAAARTWADAKTRRLQNPTMVSRGSNVMVKVGLGPYFSDFYSLFLEPNDDVLLYYYNNDASQSTLYNNHSNDTTGNDTTTGTIPIHRTCHSTHRAKTMFNHFFQHNWYTDTRISFVQSLIPNEMIRNQAQRYLQQQLEQQPQHQELASFDRSPVSSHFTNDRPTIVTVHRRNFEGKCQKLIKKRNYVACLDRMTGNKKKSSDFFSAQDLTNFCELNYNTIQSDLNITTTTTNEIQNQPHNHRPMMVLLCSDRQVPLYDDTFPHLVSITPEFPDNNQKDYNNEAFIKPTMIMIEAWIMTLSDIHYGIPISTIDVVVHIWRNRLLVVPPQNRSIPDHDHSPPPLREMRPLSCYGSNSML